MRKIAASAAGALIGALSFVPAAFAQVLGGTEGISNFMAGNIIVVGTVFVVVTIFTIFIESHLKRKGYTEYLGGPKVPGAICAAIALIFVFGSYVPAILDAAPILTAIGAVVGIWYVGMIVMAFATTAVGRAEAEEEKAALLTAQSAAHQLRAEGVPGAQRIVEEVRLEERVIHDLVKLREEARSGKEIGMMQEVDKLIKDQEEGLRIEVLIATMMELLGKAERGEDPIYGIIIKVLPELERQKIDEDKKDVIELKAMHDRLALEIQDKRKAMKAIREGTKESRKLRLMEKEVSLLNRIINELLKEELLAEREKRLTALVAKAEKRKEKEAAELAREAEKYGY